MNTLTRSTPRRLSRPSVGPGLANSSDWASKIVSSGGVRDGAACAVLFVVLPAQPPTATATHAGGDQREPERQAPAPYGAG